jgi:hypothetical protein
MTDESEIRNPKSEIEDALQRFLTIRCSQCWDSFISVGMYGPDTCKGFHPAMQLSDAALKISEVVVARLANKRPVDLQMLDAARSLANATAENPISGDILQGHLRCDRRRLSELMRRLRDEWLLPVIASRRPPIGYFIAATAEQLLEWNRVTRAQALSELATSYRLVKANHPLLAGQQPLDFISQISTELQEAIR